MGLKGKWFRRLMSLMLMVCMMGVPIATPVVAAESTQEVSTVQALAKAVEEANAAGGNCTIVLSNGTYALNQLLYITAPYVTIKSKSGNYNDAIIKGAGMNGGITHGLLVAAKNFTIEGVSIGEVANHCIQIQGEQGAHNATVRNCRLFNGGEQLLKVSYSKSQNEYVKGGVVENCLFEYTAGQGPQYYIGGVDAHHAQDWVVKNNTFKNIKSPEKDLAEHAVHFWSGSKGTRVEGNTIINCDRGIGFGLGDATHYDGVILNNFVYTTRDVGIGLENAQNTKVYNNTVYAKGYANAIEYRFAGTTADIQNNLTIGVVAKRNNGTATLKNNAIAKEGWFVNSSAGDLHLASAQDKVVDQGAMLSEVPNDIDGTARPVGGGYDIGADEYGQGAMRDVPEETKDVPADWATAGIEQLKERSLLKEDFYKKYQSTITRKEFAYIAVMLYQEFSKEPLDAVKTNKNTFTDTQDQYVLIANGLGIVSGYGNGKFGPEDSVTREQICVMLVKTIQKSGRTLDGNGLGSIRFNDHNQISSWALDSVRLAYKNGIIKGVSQGTIAPKQNTTREQALVLLNNIIEKKSDFPKGQVNPTPTPEPAVQGGVLQAPVLKWANGAAYNSWCETGWYATPAAADLNGDGIKEIIASAYSVAALDSNTGTLLWRNPSGFDRSKPSAKSVGRTWPDIITQDIDGDGAVEIVTAHSGGYVSVYNQEGYFESGWPQRPSQSELRGLKVADLDNDGTAEIIVSAAVGSKVNTWVYEHNGQLRAGWPQLNNDSGYAYGVFNNNVGIGDINGDGLKEIIIPSDVHYICAYDSYGNALPANAMYGGKTWGQVGVWESLEVELRGWGNCKGDRMERYRPNFAAGVAVVADVDGNGTNEVVVTGNMYDCQGGYTSKYNSVHIFNGDRSRFVTGQFNWETIPVDTGAPLSQDYNLIESNQPDLVVEDLDGDGLKELLYPAYDGKLHCFNLYKEEPANWPFAVWNSGEKGFEFASSPAVVDLNGDGKKEVIITTWTQKTSGRNGSLYVLDYQGNPLFETPLPSSFGTDKVNGALPSPLVDDVDGDGEYEIVLNTVHSGFVTYDLPGSTVQ